ncbi:class I SAM-dependent methyltransferase [Actinoplanes sp. NPDC049668]|uniref:class I SAM-dependent methyltransferase n=2 Tax=unclassified Actinoplanes TaxID=2626549 RepID=UPI0037A81694
MLDYDREADRYDDSRGGEARADEAARAVERLLPSGAGTVIDVGAGTGIVSTRLRRPGRVVVAVDRSSGMLARAAGRLGGRAVRGDATRLPLRPGRADAVVSVWLLHLLSDAGPVVAEAARVLRAGGVLITTVDKEQSRLVGPSDLADLAASSRREHGPLAADAWERVTALAAARGLVPAGETTFVGVGQGLSPRELRGLPAGWLRELDLAALPDQDRRRPDPVYTLVAFRKTTPTASTGR